MAPMRYDAIVVGGGHNGLVAAAYLARAGKRVCVLERRSVPGGCCSTEELWPGFKVSPAAYVVSLFAPAIIRELELEHFGLSLLPRDPSSFTPLPDGRSLLLGNDEAANRSALSQFSSADADRLPEFEAFLDRIVAKLDPVLTGQQPALPPRWQDWSLWWQYLRAACRLGDDLRPALELILGPIGPVLERWFESDVLRATLATDGIIGAFGAPSTPGSGYVFLHHVMGKVSGRRGVWAYVRGGMGGLTDALLRSCQKLGVDVRLESEVRAVNQSGGRAVGVTLSDGTALEAEAIVSNLDARRTFLGLVGKDRLPASMATETERMDYSSASAKVNLALDDLPDFKTGDIERSVALRGTTHIAPGMAYIERAFRDACGGDVSAEPVLEVTIPSTVDDSLAPAGKHVMSLFVQYAPYHLKGTGWDATEREKLGDRCLDLLSQYAPNIKDHVLHRQVLTPVDLEQTYGLTGGNIFQGAMSLNQIGPLRPGFATAIPGLWLCGATTHPGGGVMGIGGYQASKSILRGMRWA